MKIQKREWARPLHTITLFLIPLMTYLIYKISGVEMKREWLWWIIIPVMIITWGLINFKLSSKK